mmetsp:Transcript_30041/g.84773  ORF Transcript_30041/g.84773 Transcript_30041/m.84773 type:complete len:246 (-) Transcript_30041:2370-3107(-)
MRRLLWGGLCGGGRNLLYLGTDPPCRLLSLLCRFSLHDLPGARRGLPFSAGRISVRHGREAEGGLAWVLSARRLKSPGLLSSRSCRLFVSLLTLISWGSWHGGLLAGWLDRNCGVAEGVPGEARSVCRHSSRRPSSGSRREAGSCPRVLVDYLSDVQAGVVVLHGDYVGYVKADVHGRNLSAIHSIEAVIWQAKHGDVQADIDPGHGRCHHLWARWDSCLNLVRLAATILCCKRLQPRHLLCAAG